MSKQGSKDREENNRGRECVAKNSLDREKLSPKARASLGHRGPCLDLDLPPPPLHCHSPENRDVVWFIPVSPTLPWCLAWSE